MSTASLGGRRIVVTGATGFLGSAFVRRAVRDGCEVTIVAREGADHWRLTTVSGRYATLTTDLSVLHTAQSPAGGVDVVVHFAAAGVDQRFDDVEVLVQTNVVGTLRVLQFAQRAGAARVVVIGSSGEYGPGDRLTEEHPLAPTSEYGATRASASLLARAFAARRGLDLAIVRPFAVYGPYEGAHRLVPHTILCGLRGLPIRISSGEQRRDYVFVDDVIDGIAMACVEASARGTVLNLCSGRSIRVLDAVEMVADLTGARSKIVRNAVPTIPGEMWHTSGDPDRARAVLGWTARTDLASGLASTIAWFRDVGAQLGAYRG